MLVERRFLDVQSQRIVVDLPPGFVNHQVEMILIALDTQEAAAPEQNRSAAEADALLAATAGAWGRRSAADVQALIESQRKADWRDE